MNVSIPEHIIVAELVKALDQPEGTQEHARRDARYAQTNEELLEYIADGIVPLLNSENPLIFRYIESLYDMRNVVSWDNNKKKTIIDCVALQEEFVKRRLPLYLSSKDIPANNSVAEFRK